MATQQEYSYVANALVAFAHKWISALPSFEQSFIPMDKVPVAAGATAKEAVDALDQYRAAHPKPVTASVKFHKRRRKHK
jgi:hypothetical protein